MERLKSMERSRLAVVGVVLAAILLVSINVFSSTVFRGVRLDLTQDRLFTLSDSTYQVLRAIDEPITIKFFFSRALAGQSPAHANYAVRVRELLEHYAELAAGKLRLEVHDPEPYSVKEDAAVTQGLQSVPLDRKGNVVYFGLAAVNSTDDKEVIPFFDPEREPFLEYDLTRLIFNLANPKKKVVALMNSLNMEFDPALNNQPWAVLTQMRQFFEVRRLSPRITDIEDDVDVVMVVHPSALNQKARYAIDQFVLRGGRAMIFVDPLSEIAAGSRGSRMLLGGSSLEELFDAWGVTYSPDRFVGDLASAAKVSLPSEGRASIVDYVVWLELGPDRLNAEDVVTSQMRRITMGSVGALAPKEGAGTQFIPLISSSPRSMLIDVQEIQIRPDPLRLLQEFKPGGKPFVMAARIRGDARSAFPDGPPADKRAKEEAAAGGDTAGEEKQPRPHLSQSARPINVVVVADSDVLSDRFWYRAQDFFGQRVGFPIANNADFVINVLDNLTGSDALIDLRSRGLSVRPFTLIKEIQQDAELRYRKTERDLLQRMADTEKKLGQLDLEDVAEGKAILTEEQKAAMESFRRELLTTRQQLREVQHALNKDIEALDTALKVFNIWAVPAILSVLVLVMALWRRARYRRHVRTT